MMQLILVSSVVFLFGKLVASEHANSLISTRSGLRPWVDVNTPASAYTLTSSRGNKWTLVMSDEFNVPGRNFAPGFDHMWTALEMPDGVNAALEYYSINMTSTATEADGRGVFQIKVTEGEEITYRVWNNYAKPAQFETHTMYYRAGMVQSWNKFCFQGGRLEVVAQLPAVLSSRNPDMGGNRNDRVKTMAFYPAWPGVWLMGNLGRALFSQSTSRMWPWSYNECNLALKSSQRISACDGRPGYGLNPYQGRGAPEIDLLEGGGTAISSSIQLAPGMPAGYRKFPPTNDVGSFCVYSGTCQTSGANFPGIPAQTYAARAHKSWYQGLRYAPNTFCTPIERLKQDPDVVMANLKQGITSNTCQGVNSCPASGDGYSSVELIDGQGPSHWGINANGTCMPLINGYTGSFLCDPDNSNPQCSSPVGAEEPKYHVMEPFAYQMDAISANWPVHLAAYTSFLTYQVEWVLGSHGYLRWMLESVVLFEIPAESVETVPQDAATSNPKKLMLEEPMYLILNVALSASWGARPPNPGARCRGDGTNAQDGAVCDGFPMYLKIDSIRLYQDVSSSSTMAIGCDPPSHPTKAWIQAHLNEYETTDNKWIPVHGGATCRDNEDCTVSTSSIVTGTCDRKKRCRCLSEAWSGPRCTLPLTSLTTGHGFGPPVLLSTLVGAFVLLLFGVIAYKIVEQWRKNTMVTNVGVRQPALVHKIELKNENVADDKVV